MANVPYNYIWDIAKSYPNKYWLKYDWTNNPEHLQFFENKIIDLNNCDIVLFLNKDVDKNKFIVYYYILSDAVNLVSRKLSEIIAKVARDDVQLIETKVFQENGFVNNYYIPIVGVNYY